MATARGGMLSEDWLADWIMINVGGGVEHIYVPKGTSVWCGNIGAQWMHPGHGKPNDWFMMKRVKMMIQQRQILEATNPKITIPMKSRKPQVMKRTKGTKPQVMKRTKRTKGMELTKLKVAIKSTKRMK